MILIIKRTQVRVETKRLSIVFAPKGATDGWAGIVTWNRVTWLTYNTYASAQWKKRKGKINEAFDRLARRTHD